MDKAQVMQIPGVVSIGRIENGWRVEILEGHSAKEIPSTIRGERVTIEVVKEIVQPPSGNVIDQLRQRRRPMMLGQQITTDYGHGSIGCFVQWRGKTYMITAAHLATRWRDGDIIWQPTRSTIHQVGRLRRWIDIYQFNGGRHPVPGDAMAIELNEEAVNQSLGGIQLTSLAEPQIGMRFIRYGRTTGRREDVITEVDSMVRLLGVGDRPQWTCDNVFKGRFYSAMGGDSGGGMFTPDGKFLGLCMHPQGGCAIKPSMEALGMADATLPQNSGNYKYMDVAPVIIDGRTMVPIRFVAEGLGARVDWQESDKSVTITQGRRQVKIWIGETKYQERIDA